MDAIAGVTDGSCTDCDGPNPADCAAATCDTDYHSFVDGVGCAGGPYSKGSNTHAQLVALLAMEWNIIFENALLIFISPRM
jgi:hypothetical protein